MSIVLEIQNAKEVQRAFHALPEIMSPLIRGELKRAGKRFSKMAKARSLSGSPGILLPKSGGNKRKAQKRQIIDKVKVIDQGGDFDFVLMGKGVKFLRWHREAGKTIAIESSFKDAIQGLAQKIGGTVERAWKIAADKHMSGRFF